ncbi:MAG: hypothetical protein ABMA13_12480 [Chthoniobacteraceae bacterium]
MAESRKWREATSRKLDAMAVAERLAHLASVRERYAAERESAAASLAGHLAHEEPAAPKPAKAFDAVKESRKWKEAVAREIEGMSAAERVAYFQRHSSVETAESCVVREDAPKPQT